MRQKTRLQKPAAEHVIKDIRRATRKHHSAEDKIRIVLEGLRGEGSESSYIPKAYMELGGFQIGANDSQFTSWTNNAGDILNDNVIAYGPDKDATTNQISYTFKGGNGFSAMFGLEQGATSDFGYTTKVSVLETIVSCT